MENKVMVAVISLTGVIGMPLFLTYVNQYLIISICL